MSSSSQFGFRSGASTEHALLKFTDDILKCFDDNKLGIATFIDLSNAFDCVDHKILLTKIKRYGVHSTPLRWIRSYRSNREHFVSWNQIQSTSLNLNIGVPKGSILGPLLFQWCWTIPSMNYSSMILWTRVMSCSLYFCWLHNGICSKWFYWQCDSAQYRIGQSSIVVWLQ